MSFLYYLQLIIYTQTIPEVIAQPDKIIDWSMQQKFAWVILPRRTGT